MMNTKTKRGLTAVCAALTLVLGASACSATGAQAQWPPEATESGIGSPSSLCDLGSCHTATVDRVVDGDTLDVVTDTGELQRVRVLGIDTPETVHPDKPVGCMGPEASAAAGELAPVGSIVTVVTDEQADAFDRYGRQLAHVVVRGSSGEQNNLGAALLEKGLAIKTTFPHSLTGHYADLQDIAEHNHLGVWGHC